MAQIRTRIYSLLAVTFAVLIAIFIAAAHKSKPYFAEIPMSLLATWKEAPYIPAGSGKDWKFSQYIQGAGAMNHDVNHYVLQRDGKIYGLANANDAWGFANAPLWDIDLQGSQLYIFDAHQHVSPGWFHMTTGTRGWLIDRLGFGPEGGFRVTSPPDNLALPPNPRPGSLFKLDNKQLKYVGIFKGSDEVLEELDSGDYYLAPPGIGIKEVFDLSRTTQAHSL